MVLYTQAKPDSSHHVRSSHAKPSQRSCHPSRRPSTTCCPCCLLVATAARAAAVPAVVTAATVTAPAPAVVAIAAAIAVRDPRPLTSTSRPACPLGSSRFRRFRLLAALARLRLGFLLLVRSHSCIRSRSLSFLRRCRCRRSCSRRGRCFPGQGHATKRHDTCYLASVHGVHGFQLHPAIDDLALAVESWAATEKTRNRRRRRRTATVVTASTVSVTSTVLSAIATFFLGILRQLLLRDGGRRGGRGRRRRWLWIVAVSRIRDEDRNVRVRVREGRREHMQPRPRPWCPCRNWWRGRRHGFDFGSNLARRRRCGQTWAGLLGGPGGRWVRRRLGLLDLCRGTGRGIGKRAGLFHNIARRGRRWKAIAAIAARAVVGDWVPGSWEAISTISLSSLSSPSIIPRAVVDDRVQGVHECPVRCQRMAVPLGQRQLT